MDAGARVVVVPTVDTVEEAVAARNWTYFPPLVVLLCHAGGSICLGSLVSIY
jgi:hypothetical protein